MSVDQSVNINFAQGMDTKTDPWQLPVGEFLLLQNAVFKKGGLLTKRNGYGVLRGTPPPSSYLTTLNGNAIAVGDTISAYSESTNSWITKGNLQPVSLSVLPVIRNNLNQVQTDSATANSLICITYVQLNAGAPSYFYAVEDATTGQNIVPSSSFPVLAGGVISGSSRVFVVGNFFVIVSPVVVGGTTFLQYVSISLTHPTNISAAQNTYPEAYDPTSINPGWDGAVSNGALVLAYNTTAGGQGVHVTSLTASQIAANSDSGVVHAFTNALYKAAILSVCVDTTVSPNIFYISFWNSTTTNGYTCAVFATFGAITTQFTPQQIITASAVVNLASSAQNNSCLVYSEVHDVYSYDTSVNNDHVNAVTVSNLGVVGTPYVVVRGVGLASKAFIVNGVSYFLSAYDSQFQPSYFLINGSISTSASPVVVAKLAYQNGGGYLLRGLPSVTLTGSTAQISYLFKQDVEALNTLSNPQQTTAGGIYSQLGINLASLEIGTMNIGSSEIAQDLHLSGGFLGMFDGYYPVEHNFFVFPEPVTAVWSATGGNIPAQPDGSTNIDAYYYQATYEWTDMQGNAFRSRPSIAFPITTTGTASTGSITVHVPTLRLTAKIPNPVKIVIYRWSVEDQVYNQVTTIDAPLLNNPTIDFVTFVDTFADASIVGNNLIYTTGGVVPDTNGPASDIMTLFDTRLCLVDAEDPNVLWISKTVIEGVPVEMCSEFTIYVAPNIGTTGSSGPMKSLAPMDDKLIIGKKNSFFYINGTGPDNLGTTSAGCSLGNYSQPTFITSVVGCTNQKSMVLTQDGLMFQSDKGIWILTRNLQTEYIGAPVEAYNSSIVTSANVIPDTNYVLFTLDTGEMLMYDYYYKKWGVFAGVPTVSSCIYNGLHTVLDQYGEILQETPDQYLDRTNPVLIKFITSWINLASLQGYERFYEFYILAKYLSPHFIVVDIAYDYNPSISHQVTISPKNFSPATPSPFGVPTPFGSPGYLEQWRIHAKKQLCQSFQLTLSEVFDPAYGTIPGAGFTMSGMNCKVQIKKALKPIRGANTAG